MNRMDRLIAILIQLQTKRIVKAKEIAERFGISLRTVYRDISALEEAGIPIGSDAGIGYYLAEDYHIPPVMFTVQEAGALIMAEKFMERFSDSSMEEHYKSALYKIKAVMKNRDKDYLEGLQDKIGVWQITEERSFSENMTVIQNALSSRKVIHIKYQSPGSPKPVSRDIEPLSMGFYELHWHLLAYCRLKKQYRNFRIDRMEEIKLTEESFDDKKHGSVQKILKEMLSYKHLLPVTLKVDKGRPYDIIKNKCIPGLAEERDIGDKVELTFWSDSLEILGRWLLNYETGVEIISPPELKAVMKNYVRALVKQYMEPI